MNPHEILRRFPNASKSLLAANTSDYGTGLIAEDTRKTAKLERPAPHQSSRENANQKIDSIKCHLRIVSVRKRQIDPDNISVKYLIDALRYAGVIQDDAAKDITLEVSQRKCLSDEDEHTEVSIYRQSEAPRRAE